MARRTNLREFQERLLTRLEATDSADAGNIKLGFRLGEQHYLVDLTSIEEVLPVPPLDNVPLTQGWYAGVANIRGKLYSIIDLAAFSGQPTTEFTRASRVVLIRSQLLPGSALMVSAIAGLRNTQQYRYEAQRGPSWILARHHEEAGEHAGRTWNEIDIAALVSEREFLEVAQ